MIDESTDISTDNDLLECRLLELIHIDGKSGTADKIYSAFIECLDQKYGILITNITWLACDGAAVMVGKNNSYFLRLKSDVPDSLLLKCICHSTALVASKACTKLPEILEDIMRGVYSYVAGSSKRCDRDQLKEMQSYFQIQYYKILNLAGTRWFAVHQCVERLLLNWDILKYFFSNCAF